MDIQKTIDAVIMPDEEVSLALCDGYSSATVLMAPQNLKDLLERVATLQHNATLSGRDKLITDKLTWPDEND